MKIQLPDCILLDVNYVIEDSIHFAKKANEIIFKTIKESYPSFSRHDFNISTSDDEMIKNPTIGTVPLFHHYVYWRHILAKLISEEYVDIEQVHDIYHKFILNYAKESKIYPDVIDTLKYFKNKSKIAVITNGNPFKTYHFIKEHKIDFYVDLINTSGETPYKKPDSLFFNSMISDLKTDPWKTIMVGDRPDNDISGANRCGIWTALLKRSASDRFRNELNFEGPDFEINSLSELKGISLNTKGMPDTVVLLAGGRGSRMGHLCNAKQKCLLEIASGVSALEANLRVWEKVGMNKIIIITNNYSEQVERYLQGRLKGKSEIKCIETNEKGTALALLEVAPFIKGRFIISHANILYEQRLAFQVIKYALKHSDDQILVTSDGSFAPTHAATILGDNAMRPLKGFMFFEKKGELATSLPISFGVGVLNLSIFEFLRKCGPYDMVENGLSLLQEETGAIVWPIKYEGDCCHIECPDDLIIANKFVNKHLLKCC